MAHWGRGPSILKGAALSMGIRLIDEKCAFERKTDKPLGGGLGASPGGCGEGVTL
jgi:hypothetical protein